MMTDTGVMLMECPPFGKKDRKEVICMNLNELFSEFSNKLKARTKLLTEDNIRYYLFAAMLKQDDNLNNYVLELPYVNEDNNLIKGDFGTLNNQGERLELDLYYSDGDEELIIEIKFHRKKSNSSAARTSGAGQLFNDIKRLELINTNNKKCKKMLVYVTDDVMHNYFTNPQGGNKNKNLKSFLNCFYANGIIDYTLLEKEVGNERNIAEIFRRQATDSFNVEFTLEFFMSNGKGSELLYGNDFKSNVPNIQRNLHIRVIQIL